MPAFLLLAIFALAVFAILINLYLSKHPFPVIRKDAMFIRLSLYADTYLHCLNQPSSGVPDTTVCGSSLTLPKFIRQSKCGPVERPVDPIVPI